MENTNEQKPKPSDDLIQIIIGGTDADFLEGIAATLPILRDVGVALAVAAERMQGIALKIREAQATSTLSRAAIAESETPQVAMPDRTQCRDFLVAVKTNRLLPAEVFGDLKLQACKGASKKGEDLTEEEMQRFYILVANEIERRQLPTQGKA